MNNIVFSNYSISRFSDHYWIFKNQYGKGTILSSVEIHLLLDTQASAPLQKTP